MGARDLGLDILGPGNTIGSLAPAGLGPGAGLALPLPIPGLGGLGILGCAGLTSIWPGEDLGPGSGSTFWHSFLAAKLVGAWAW